MMKIIQLTQGKVAFIDDEDYEKVNQYKWRASQTHGHWYASRGIHLPNGKWTTQLMHRFIMGLERGNPQEVDHKDRVNTLDNRRENLRIATLEQNQQNRGLLKNNTSGYKGISWHEGQGTRCWRACLMVNGKRKYLGYFSTPELAAAAYDAGAIKHHGEFAVTNQMLAAA